MESVPYERDETGCGKSHADHVFIPGCLDEVVGVYDVSDSGKQGSHKGNDRVLAGRGARLDRLHVGGTWTANRGVVPWGQTR